MSDIRHVNSTPTAPAHYILDISTSKNHQGGLADVGYDAVVKHVYASKEAATIEDLPSRMRACPYTLLQHYLSLLPRDAVALFIRANSAGAALPFNNQAVGKDTLSKKIKVSTGNTSHGMRRAGTAALVQHGCAASGDDAAAAAAAAADARFSELRFLKAHEIHEQEWHVACAGGEGCIGR